MHPRLISPALTHITALAFILILSLWPSPASSQDPTDGPGFFYSYEQAQIGDTPQWVLVPRTLRAPLTSDLETNVRAAFKALSASKKPTYGRASILISPADLKKGKVTIDLDPEKLSFQPIIEAEVLATFATLGLSSVEFKADGHSKTLQPHQVPFASFALTVPMWRALPPAALPPYTLVALPDGSVVSSQSFTDKVKSSDAATIKLLLSELESGLPDSQQGLLERLPTLKISGWDSAAIKLLERGPRDSQLAVIRASTKASTKDLLDAMAKLVEKSPDAEVRTAAADALSKSGDPRFASMAAVSSLRSGDSAAAIKAIDDLVSKRSAGAAAEIAKTLSSDEAVARRAASALRELNASPELLAALKDDTLPLPIRELIAQETSRLSSRSDAFYGFAFLASNAPTPKALPAIEALSRFTDPKPTSALEKALAHPSSSRARRAAAQALADLKDPDAIKAMSRATQSFPDDASSIEAAMVSLLASSERVDDLKERLKKSGSDPQMKRATFYALAMRAEKDKIFKNIHDKLTDGATDKDPLIRGGALLGLSVHASDEDLPTITAAASDSSPRTRQDVALALSNYPSGKATDTLLKLLSDSDPTVIAASADALGKRKETSSLRDLIKQQRHDSPIVRAALIPAIAQMFSPDNKGDVLSAISKGITDKDPNVKFAAIAALGPFNESASLDALALVTADPDPSFQQAAYAALGQTKAPRAVDLLAAALKSENPDNRKAALLAMREHGSRDLPSKIDAALSSEADPEVKALAAEVIADLKK
jgi:HEAT repeat protein